MADVVINEISQNYAYNIGTSTYATVAIPITSSWGDGLVGDDIDTENLESVVWRRFPATQAGLEAFVAAYRGPASNYRSLKDYSYQQALTLLTSGYDILTCRLSAGAMAGGIIYKPYTYSAVVGVETAPEYVASVYYERTGEDPDYEYTLLTSETAPSDWSTNYDAYFIKDQNDEYVSVSGVIVAPPYEPNKYYTRTGTEPNYVYTVLTDETAPDNWATSYTNYYTRDVAVAGLTVNAKYPGSFGNTISVKVTKGTSGKYWSSIVYVTDSNGVATAVENKLFTLEEDHETDSIPVLADFESDLVVYTNTASLDDSDELISDRVTLTDGSDSIPNGTLESAAMTAALRYTLALGAEGAESAYVTKIESATADPNSVCNREVIFTLAYYAYDLLKDRLAYNAQRVVSPWDDQDFGYLKPTGGFTDANFVVSPLHTKLAEVSYLARCTTALIDVPKGLTRAGVWDEKSENGGYVQKLSRWMPDDIQTDGLFSTHYAICAPWGHYKYVGTGKQLTATPSFLVLMLQRAMIKNQAIQYEWALPTNRSHTLNIGKLDYTVTKKYLDEWQGNKGVGVNIITNIPGMGISLWGNSTAYEVPPATYQALANLSTRYLVNAVKDQAFRCGIAITFQYNNEQAYSSFYAGVSPLLDSMVSVGAIDDYYIRMSEDINGLDSVNANSVIGKIYLVINGVINNITIDLIALPSGTDLSQFMA